MEKEKAKQLFGSVRELATNVGYSPAYFYSLPNPLPQRETDRIIGAAVRTGRADDVSKCINENLVKHEA